MGRHSTSSIYTDIAPGSPASRPETCFQNARNVYRFGNSCKKWTALLSGSPEKSLTQRSNESTAEEKHWHCVVDGESPLGTCRYPIFGLGMANTVQRCKRVIPSQGEIDQEQMKMVEAYKADSSASALFKKVFSRIAVYLQRSCAHVRHPLGNGTGDPWLLTIITLSRNWLH